MPQPTTTGMLSANARAVLHKLPTADAVTVMEDMMSKVAGVNNSNNNAKPSELSREEMVKKINELPDANLKAILKTHGIIE
ncbi:MAG: hypothetical protein M1608_16920 [Candidatus Omnitrophica bacterium]|nr:hypothetical protein [Candidatus Omnitrophota bacterium]